MKNSLSATVITKNEQEQIARCLSSVVGLADEIIVVDSGSKDKTLEIAEEFGAKIYKRVFDDFSSQRNFAISKATSKWVLSLDADEEIPKELAEEIREAINESSFDGYLIPRKNIIFGKEIKHSRWAPDRHVWLFKKSRGKFVNEIHEEVEVEGAVGELENAKIHYSHRNVSEFLEMMNAYTTREAEFKNKKNIKFSYLKLIYYPLRSFAGRYFLKSGYLDGWRGFVLSYLRAIYQFTVFVKLWHLQEKS